MKDWRRQYLPAAAASLLLFACSEGRDTAVLPAPAPAPAQPEAPEESDEAVWDYRSQPSQLTEDDFAVLDAVFAELSADQQFVPLRSFAEKRGLLLSDRTKGGTYFPSLEALKFDSPPEASEVVTAAYRAMRHRNQAPVSLGSYRPDSANVLVITDDQRSACAGEHRPVERRRLGRAARDLMESPGDVRSNPESSSELAERVDLAVMLFSVDVRDPGCREEEHVTGVLIEGRSKAHMRIFGRALIHGFHLSTQSTDACLVDNIDNLQSICSLNLYCGTAMDWINYHHFMYFWLTVKEGGIQAASRRLRLAHPTVSVQIKRLEESLGHPLFDRSRRKLRLTETGELAFRYADEIFSLGQEFLNALEGHSADRPVRLSVGVSDVMPKLIVRQLLDPALRLESPVKLRCSEDRFDRLLGELATHRLDVVIADTPCPPGSAVKAFNHLLGECGVAFFAARKLATRLAADFPAALDGAPMLMPASDTALGRSVTQWFESRNIRPEVVAEFDDSALMKTFGQDGFGAFPLPAITEPDVTRQYKVRLVGETNDIQARFYAISPERRLKNPAVVAICETARSELFPT